MHFDLSTIYSETELGGSMHSIFIYVCALVIFNDAPGFFFVLPSASLPHIIAAHFLFFFV